MGKTVKFRDVGKNAPTWIVRINKLMEKDNLSQKELALKLGVSESTVSGWVGLNKKDGTVREPRMSLLQDLANCFGVTVDYLLGGSECRTPSDEKIHQVTGLSDLSIGRLKQGQKLIKSKKVSAEKKVYVLNYLIEHIGESELLDDMYDYLFGAFKVKLEDGEKEGHGLQLLTSKLPNGEEKTIVAYNEIFAQAHFANVQRDIMRMKDKIMGEREENQ